MSKCPQSPLAETPASVSDRVGPNGVPNRYPVEIVVATAYEHRNRLTCALRPILAIPHILLVGAPFALGFSWGWSSDGSFDSTLGSGGALGIVAAVSAVIAWFAIVFTGKHPDGLWRMAAFYLHWRTRALAYVTLLRDEYPPFGPGEYPARLRLPHPAASRDRVTVGFRILLAIPHLIVLWALSIAWGLVTLFAWFAIVFTGRYPASLYRFSVSVLRWNLRVESYLLLLRDEYPPFSLG